MMKDFQKSLPLTTNTDMAFFLGDGEQLAGFPITIITASYYPPLARMQKEAGLKCELGM